MPAFPSDPGTGGVAAAHGHTATDDALVADELLNQPMNQKKGTRAGVTGATAHTHRPMAHQQAQQRSC